MSHAVSVKTSSVITNLEVLVTAIERVVEKCEVFAKAKEVDLGYGNRVLSVAKFDIKDPRSGRSYPVAIKQTGDKFEMVYDHMYDANPIKEVGIVYDMTMQAAVAAPKGYQVASINKVVDEWVIELQKA